MLVQVFLLDRNEKTELFEKAKKEDEEEEKITPSAVAIELLQFNLLVSSRQSDSSDFLQIPGESVSDSRRVCRFCLPLCLLDC